MAKQGTPDQPPTSRTVSVLYLAGAGLLVACIIRIVAVRMALSPEVSFAVSDIAWFVAYAALIVGGLAMHALFREMDRRRRRLCPHCGYDLTGTLQAGIRRCPECGNELKKGE